MTVEKTYPIVGLNCVSCAQSAQNALKNTPGVEEAQVHFASKRAEVVFNDEQTRFEELAKSIASVGYTLLPTDAEAASARERYYRGLIRKTGVAVAVAVAVMLVGWLAPHTAWVTGVQLLLTLPVLVYSGRDFYVNAWKQLRQRELSMDTLIALGTAAAFVLSVLVFLGWAGQDAGFHHESPVMIIAFVLVGKLLEYRAEQQTDQSLESLLSLAPQTAHLVDGTSLQEVPVEALRPGDVIEVQAGETVPLDGIIIEGDSWIDESMLTGEPVPVARRHQDSVLAGTINTGTPIRIRATQPASETALSRIIQEVLTAQSSQAPAQRIADQVIRYFVPLVVGIALVVFFGWWYRSGEFIWAFERALTVLVVSCPCALGLATPVVIKQAITQASRRGVLVRSARALETLASIDTVVFDKTGTLTGGKPQVVQSDWQTNGQPHPEEALTALANQSQHPLARAIVRHLEAEHPELTRKKLRRPMGFAEHPGLGMQGQVRQQEVRVGSRAYLEAEGVDLSPLASNGKPAGGNGTGAQDGLEVQVAGTSEVYGAVDGQLYVRWALADALQAGARAVVQKLQSRGLSLHILTGDKADTARALAGQVGIDQVQAEAMPEDKAAYIRTLQDGGSKVLVIGDGINDAIALSTADVSIAMGHGTQIAIETASCTLVNGSLSLLPSLLHLARGARRLIRQNLFWAFGYMLLAMPAAAGLVPALTFTPGMAGGLMALSSLTVVLNSLRLRFRPPEA